ncbi:MAG TPA: carboxypeptidase regulatory-like domain-containing protein [Pyrinomonadaceae bacterium]|nr:carboxypeptidase regulatory-like domain-containing protein [Pyrinomonadaceae bacterium]
MRRVAALVFILLTSFILGQAQSTNASLAGRITDPANALIVDAQVAAISTGTNIRYEDTTNNSGEYHLPNLPPASYRLEIQKPGFKKLIKPDVVLHVQDALRIDLQMTLGDVSETVLVESGAPLVNTKTAVVSTVINRTFVENIPLNGRSFQTLIQLAPGVVLTPSTFNDQGQFSVNGQRADANYFMVDGVSANFGVTGFIAMMQSASGALPALSASGGTNSLVSVDAMQEFRIQTSSFAPEFGRTPGGQISIATRSGTNAFHGTLFEYFRNDVLDARDWFVNFNGLPKPAERLNDFGGVLGGPVVKDKTFFFFSYEGQRLRQPSSMQTVVPDNQSRQQAPAPMRPYLNAYPVANGPALAPGVAQFNASFSNPSSLDAYSIRLDHSFRPTLNLFGRYNYSPSNMDQRGPLFSSGRVLSATNSLSSTVQTGTIGLTQIISPEISNEVRANYSNHRIGIDFVMDNFGGATPPSESLLFPSGITSANGNFLFIILGVGQYVQGKQGTTEQRQVNLIDNLSVTKGNHQLKFGVDYRWLAPFSSPAAYRQFAAFSGVNTAPGGALSGVALLAQSSSFQTNALLSQNFSLFGQDTWKITPRVTITYGLRWDVNPALKGKNRDNDPFTVIGIENPATMTLAPRGTPLYETTYGNIAPRIGVAYQFGGIRNWDAALRAGFGVFYDLGQGSLGGVSSFFPYIVDKNFSGAPFPLGTLDAAAPALTTNLPAATMLVADPHLKLPRTYQWNVALEQSIGNNQTISATYVAAIGRELLRVTNLFNVNPNFQFIALTDNSATSDYHALQVKYQRRLSRGLQALGSYSWSHSIDIASTDAIATNTNTPGQIADINVDRGNSNFDIRHAFTAGVTYDLPSPTSNRTARAILSGWSIDSFFFARSAPPVNIVGGSFFAAGTQLAPRPNVIPGVPLEIHGSQFPGGKIFNRAAFSAAPAGTQGNLGRNVLRGFGAWQADVGLQRRFHLSERLRLRFRAEFFNIFNHPNFGNPTNVLTSPLFGRSTQTLANSLGSGGANGGLNPLYQVGGPRSIQFALKLQF